jgi:hypothetical protein
MGHGVALPRLDRFELPPAQMGRRDSSVASFVRRGETATCILGLMLRVDSPCTGVCRAHPATA